MKISVVILLFFTLILSVGNTTVNYQQPSEMSLLMRQMLVYVKAEKQRIQKNKKPQLPSTEFEKITTAAITPGKQIPDEHAAYIHHFQLRLKEYEHADKTVRKEKFNALINSCITCHEHECPGPVNTIRKNRVQ